MTQSGTSSLSVLGHYTLCRKLGEGAMGEVWLAHDQFLDREVAVKLLRSGDGALDERRRRDLVREAQATARLNHHNVVTIYEVGEAGGRVFIVMEYVSGGSLADELRTAGALPWRDATQALRDAVAGLEAAHDAGLIHRDIKPSNLMRSRRGLVKVVDFGLSKGGGEADMTRTAEGAILGSPAYMSPEQFRGEAADNRSDLYSAVCSYYELLTRQLPFSGDNLPALAYQHCHTEFPDAGTKLQGLPDGARRILARGSSKDPLKRYQTATQLLADVEALLQAPQVSHTFDGLGLMPGPRGAALRRRLESDGSDVRWLAFLPDGERLLGDCKKTWLWDVASGDSKIFESGASISADGRWLNIGAEFFSTDTGVLVSRPTELAVGGIAAADGSIRIPFCLRGRPTKLFDVSREAWVMYPASRVSPFSSDGRYCLMRTNDACVVMDTHTQQQLASARGAFGWLSISPDGSLALIKDYNDSEREIWLWDWRADRRIPLPARQRGASADFSPDGKRVITEARWDAEAQTLTLWNISQPASPRKVWEKVSKALGVTAWSADGSRLLAAVHDDKKNLALFDADTGNEICAFNHEEPGGVVQRIAFSPDGRFAATSRSGDSAISVWNLPEAPR